MIFIMIVVTITGIFMAINYLLIYTLGFLYISKSFDTGLSMFPLDSFMSCLHSLPGYSIGEFQALQLIVLAAFGVMD